MTGNQPASVPLIDKALPNLPVEAEKNENKPLEEKNFPALETSKKNIPAHTDEITSSLAKSTIQDERNSQAKTGQEYASTTETSNKPLEAPGYCNSPGVFLPGEQTITNFSSSNSGNKPLENVPASMTHPTETPYVPTIYHANTPWMPGELEEYEKNKNEEPTKTQNPYWDRLDHFTQVFPIISQARSLMQLAVGDTHGARQTQSNFINRFLEGVAGKLPDAPDLTNRSKWMEETAECVPGFKNKKLYEISIPATHNSATYTTIQAGSPWVVCQRHPIYTQLRGGIRSLDFRVCDDSGDSNLWVSHGSLCSHLINHLEEIKQFLDENPKEIVLVLMKKDWDRKLSINGLATLKRIILSFFGSKLISKKDMLELDIGELMSQGKQFGFYHESLKFGEPIVLLPTNWSWDKTNSDDPEPLFEKLTSWGESQKYENMKFTALECILTPSVQSVVTSLRPLSEVTKPVHEKLLALLRSNWTAQTNIITFDYCPDAIIEEVIKRNF